MSTEKSLPPAYDLTKSDKDYAKTEVKLQKAINDTKDSTASVESSFKNVTGRLHEAREASSIFRPDIQNFCEEWSRYHNVCFSSVWHFSAEHWYSCGTKAYHTHLQKSGEIGSVASADAEGQWFLFS